MSKPDTITLVTKAEEEIEADAADIYFCVSGSSLFSGEEAFRKASEVKAINELLIAAGIDESRIKLRKVRVDSTSLKIIKSSSAKYSIKISKVELSQLPEILGIIGSQKNCTMNRLEWVYSRAEEVRNRLRTQALNLALERAKLDAATLGIELLGIYDLLEESSGQPVSRDYIGADDDFDMLMKSSRSRTAVDLGVALGNATMAKVSLKAEFRVTPFTG